MIIITNNYGDITMRKPEEIRADIDKLVKELDAVKIYESKRDAACHILNNLGWTHSPQKGWQKPEPKRDWKEFDKDSMTHVKAGDWVRLYGTTGGYCYVRKVSDKYALLSRVIGASSRGAHVADNATTVSTEGLTVVSQGEVLKFFKLI